MNKYLVFSLFLMTVQLGAMDQNPAANQRLEKVALNKSTDSNLNAIPPMVNMSKAETRSERQKSIEDYVFCAKVIFCCPCLWLRSKCTPY